MKSKTALLLMAISLFNCKNEPKAADEPKEKTEQSSLLASDEMTLMGNFSFNDSTAVLQTNTEIYGVIIDSMATALNRASEGKKEPESNMAKVVVKAKLSAKTDKTLWEQKIEIVEILRVLDPTPDNNQIIIN